MFRNLKKVISFWPFLPIFVACNLTKGPFKTKILEFRNCIVPNETSYPLAENYPYLIYKTDIINTKTACWLKGNYTISRDITDVFNIRARSYFWEGGQWSIRLTIPALSDRRTVVKFVMNALGVNYSFNNHTVAKTSLTHFKLNLNTVEHFWDSEKEYGQWMWLLQLVQGKTSAVCVFVKIDIVPVKPSK